MKPKSRLTTQTHGYDGKLPKLVFPTPNKSLQDTIAEIKTSFTDPRIHQTLGLFLRKDNYDSLNKLDARILLRLVWEHLPPTLMNCFESVLIEIIEKGPCVQGRTIRLYQLWCVIKN